VLERRIAASAALAGRVHLRGRVDRPTLAALYAQADLFVLGSHHESVSFAFIEALSFGVAPVVTDIPGFRAFTDDGRVGALFRAGDARGLAEALVRLGRAGADAGERAARRAAVRAHFDRTMAWPALARRALAIYEDAARARAQTRGRG